MATKKVPEKKKVVKPVISAKVEIKVTATQIRGEVDKKKVLRRGPKNIGQAKAQYSLQVNGIDANTLRIRIEQASRLIHTGSPYLPKKKK